MYLENIFTSEELTRRELNIKVKTESDSWNIFCQLLSLRKFLKRGKSFTNCLTQYS